MSGNRKFYEALARRDSVVVAPEVVVATVEDEEFVPVLSAKIAWSAFFPQTHCRACDHDTSPAVLANFGGVCRRCHSRNRY